MATAPRVISSVTAAVVVFALLAGTYGCAGQGAGSGAVGGPEVADAVGEEQAGQVGAARDDGATGAVDSAAAGDDDAGADRPPLMVPIGPPLSAPSLEVAAGSVEVLHATGAGGATVERVETVETGEANDAGEGVRVPDDATAVLRWQEGARVELVAGAEARLPMPGTGPESGMRVATVRHVAGTARYSLAPEAVAEGAGLAIAVGDAWVLAAGEPTELLVVLLPAGASAEATAWLTVLSGRGAIVAGDTPPTAAEVAESGSSSNAQVVARDEAAWPRGEQSVVLAGEAIAIVAGSDLPAPLPVDRIDIEAWYGAELGNQPQGTISEIAFRCRVSNSGAAIFDAPRDDNSSVSQSYAPGVGRPLNAGSILNATGRNSGADWLQVGLAAGVPAGWIEARGLTCNGPVDQLPLANPALVAAAPTATPVPATFAVRFTADFDKVAAGDCVRLEWDVPVSRAPVTLDGELVPGKGWQRVCPDATTSYELHWTDATGKPRVERMTVAVTSPQTVLQAMAGTGGNEDSGGARGGNRAAPTPTPCDEDCIVELPTLAPTPTLPPRPTRAPTEPPDPTTAPEPTSVPSEPTSPPPPPTSPPVEPTRPGDEPTPTHTPSAMPSPTPPTASPSPSPTASPSAPGTETPISTPSPTPTAVDPVGSPTPEPSVPPGPTATPGGALKAKP